MELNLSQQPMSLITINSNVNKRNRPNDEDLLTIRVLEASERKMQLIKKLLSPEEYNSIASGLQDTLDYLNRQTNLNQLSVPAQFDILPVEDHQLDKRRSKSESNLQSNCRDSSVHDNISRKREALEFFFNEPDNNTVKRVQETDLAIELRSGYYLSFPGENEEKVVKNFAFSLRDRISGLFSYFNLSLDFFCNGTDDEEVEEQFEEFVRLHKRSNYQPISSRRNLLKMKRRLEAEKELEKVMMARRQIERISYKTEDMSETSLGRKINKNQNLVVSLHSIGHFNAMQAVRPSLHEAGELFQILKYHPLVETLAPRQVKRVNLSSAALPLAGARIVHFELLSVRITEHKLMLPEENMSMKLLEDQKKLNHLEKSYELITDKVLEFCKNNAFAPNSATGTLKRINGMLDWRTQVASRLKSMEDELNEKYDELESLREEQKFNSSYVFRRSNDTTAEKEEKLDRFKESLAKFIKLIETRSTEAESTQIESFKQFLEQEEHTGWFGRRISLAECAPRLTDDNRCPREELERRTKLKRWVRSLRVRTSIGSSFFFETPVKQNDKELLKLELSEGTAQVPLPANQSELSLKIEVLAQRHSHLPFYRDLIASMRLRISLTDLKSTNTMKLHFLDGQTEAEVDCFWTVDEKRSQMKPNLSIRKLVNSIYAKTFFSYHPFDDFKTKLAQLLNQIDPRFLMLFMSSTSEKASSPSYFALDPHLDFFEPHESHGRWLTRHALLAWRWLNKLNQIIYLSDRENLKYYELSQLEEKDTKLRETSVFKLESGHRSIDQMRLWAVDYIRKYELELRELLRFNRELRSQQESTTRLKDLLQEPKIKIDLSGLVSLNLRLIPRRTAHRPLMPKRTKLRRTHKGAKQEATQDSAKLTIDLESQVFDHWQRFASRARTLASHRLQLVITVQQASNLPMRLIQQPTTRSSTPQSSPASFFNLATSQMSTQSVPTGAQTTLLTAPTSYVEVVFQRKQQASSLAQGKNPIWHETFFFPIDVPKANFMTQSTSSGDVNSGENIGISNRPAQSQLVDEFLQLNLYDYYFYLQHEPPDEQGRRHDMPTLPMMNTREQEPLGLLDSTMLNLQSNRMLAMRQRVERHLLGSLRVPLTTLLSSGRIEGSFALNQPLFMDNYQFEPAEQQTNVSSMLTLRQQAASGGFKRNNKFETHISLFITLDPPISIPFHLYLATGSHESEQVFKFAQLWERTVCQYRKRVPKRASSGNYETSGTNYLLRHVRALVLQRDAKYCLASRLVTPLEPPKELVENRKSELNQMKCLARFVSLLSPLKYGLFNLRFLASSLWFDSTQLINKCLGGLEEKAVLLCNYFLYLGHCSAILLGDAIPEGRHAYVIVWHEQSRQLDEQFQLDASNLLESSSSGLVSSSQNQVKPMIDQNNFSLSLPIIVNAKTVQLWDPNLGKMYTLNDSLQLISIGSIVTCENVYANIQSAESVFSTNFDIRLRNFWFPLFEASSSTQNRLGDNLRRNYLKRRNQTNIRRQLIELEEMRRTIGRVAIKPIIRNEYVKFNYEKLNEEQCKQLEDAIERGIKAQLLKWRPSRPTYFNRTLSRLLAEKLKLFEVYSLEASSSTTEQPNNWKSELAEVIRNEILLPHITSDGLNARQVVSWPMNVPYTSMKTILDSLYASGVHNADLMLESGFNQNHTSTKQPTNCNTQFLVACHAFAYPARVVSVWLYVAAIITQNRPLLS